MAQQTAVEWLVKELNLEGYDYTVEQAKQMEKEQMLQIWMQFFEDSYHTRNEFIELFDKYYNETYSLTQPEWTKCPTADSLIKKESIKFSTSRTTHTSLGHMFMRNGTGNVCKICALEEYIHPFITLTNNK